MSRFSKNDNKTVVTKTTKLFRTKSLPDQPDLEDKNRRATNEPE